MATKPIHSRPQSNGERYRGMRVRCFGHEDHQSSIGKKGGKYCIKCGYYASQIKGGIVF